MRCPHSGSRTQERCSIFLCPLAGQHSPRQEVVLQQRAQLLLSPKEGCSTQQTTPSYHKTLVACSCRRKPWFSFSPPKLLFPLS